MADKEVVISKELAKFVGSFSRRDFDIAKHFYELVHKQEEPVSEDLEKAAQKAYPEDIHKQSIFIHGATYAYTHFKNTQLLDEGLEEAATKYAQDKYMAVQTFQAFRAGAQWGKNQAMAETQSQSMALAHGCPKESITEDLGEYINELFKQFPEVSFAKLSRIVVRMVKWQKEQMKEALRTEYEKGRHDALEEIKKSKQC